MFKLTRDIGIDLGTANVRVCMPDRGIVLREPSVVAVGIPDRKVLAIGERAREMLGRTPSSMHAVCPIVEGAIADFTHTEKLLEHILYKVCGVSRLFRPRVLLSVPSSVTRVQRRAVQQAAIDAGAGAALVVEAPKAAALGAGLAIASPDGNFIVDIGAGSVDIAIVTLNGSVLGHSFPIGASRIDDAIRRHLKTAHNLVISDRTAEEIKIAIGSASKEKDSHYSVSGRDVVSGLPQAVKVTPTEIRPAVQDMVAQVITRIKAILEVTPPELSADIYERGIVMTGAAAQMKGMDKTIADAIGVRVRVADAPGDCVVLGLGKMLEPGYELREDSAVLGEAAMSI